MQNKPNRVTLPSLICSSIFFTPAFQMLDYNTKAFIWLCAKKSHGGNMQALNLGTLKSQLLLLELKHQLLLLRNSNLFMWFRNSLHSSQGDQIQTITVWNQQFALNAEPLIGLFWLQIRNTKSLVKFSVSFRKYIQIVRSMPQVWIQQRYALFWGSLGIFYESLFIILKL